MELKKGRRFTAFMVAMMITLAGMSARVVLATGEKYGPWLPSAKYFDGTTTPVPGSFTWNVQWSEYLRDGTNFLGTYNANGTGALYITQVNTPPPSDEDREYWIVITSVYFSSPQYTIVYDGVTYNCPPVFYIYWGLISSANFAPIPVQYFYPTRPVTINLKYADGTPYNGTVIIKDVAFADRTLEFINGVAETEVAIGKSFQLINDTLHNDKNELVTQEVAYDGVDDVLNLTLAKTQNTFTITAKEAVTSTGIPGAVYSTVDPWGTVVSATTDVQGKAVFTLPYKGNGKYIFQEVSLPKGYKKSNTDFEMTCSGSGNGGTASKELLYSYYPQLDVSSFTLSLTDTDTQAPIAGAKFNILQGGASVRTLITDSAGVAYISGIESGVYQLKQISSAQYYNFTTTAIDFTIKSEDKVLELQNTKKRGALNIKITDSASGQPIVGAKFIISGNGVYKSIASDAAGQLPINDLPYGAYTLMENEIPSTYQPKNQNYSLILDDSTNGMNLVFTYTKAVDKMPPSISFSAAPADNSVDSFSQTLTLTDDSSGIKELKIDGVVVKSVAAPGSLTETYTHVITGNKTYSYVLTDYAGNVYTTTQNIKCINNSAIIMSDTVMANYKTTVQYNGQNTYVVNGSYTYSSISFVLSDADVEDTWGYKVEIKNESGATEWQVEKNITKLGTITERALYQSLDDGIYTIVVTAHDSHGSASKQLNLIIKRKAPPKPVISFDKSTNTTDIYYPADWLDNMAKKQYTYQSSTSDYTTSFKTSARGNITATYTDVAENKSTAMLSISPGPVDENGNPIVLPTPAPGGAGGSGAGGQASNYKIEETRNGYIYYINSRQHGSDPNITNAIIELISD